MDLSFSAEDIAFRDEVREFMRENLPASIREKKAAGRHPSKDDYVAWTRILAKRGWAVPHLAQLVQAGLLETDHLGYFKLLVDESKKNNVHRHVSPQLLKILKTSGKSFDGVTIDHEMDEDGTSRKAASPGGSR